MKWLHIGTSPSVNRTLAHVRSQFEFDKTITCNSGILLEPTPDVYLAVDMKIGHLFEIETKEAQAAGTRLVTLARSEHSIKQRKLEHFDEFITEGRSDPTLKEWGMFRLTGPMCLEYACRNGATEIVMVGCDGYRGGDAVDYFNDCWRDPRPGAEHRDHILHFAFRKVADVFTAVSFKRYGNIRKEIDAANWEDIPCAAS